MSCFHITRVCAHYTSACKCVHGARVPQVFHTAHACVQMCAILMSVRVCLRCFHIAHVSVRGYLCANVYMMCMSACAHVREECVFTVQVCPCACVHVCRCACAGVCVCRCGYVGACVCRRVCAGVCVCTGVHVCVGACVQACVCTGVRVCGCMCPRVRVRVCMCAGVQMCVVCVCLHVCRRACVEACMCARVRVQACVCVWVCVYRCACVCRRACVQVYGCACVPVVEVATCVPSLPVSGIFVCAHVHITCAGPGAWTSGTEPAFEQAWPGPPIPGFSPPSIVGGRSPPAPPHPPSRPHLTPLSSDGLSPG